MTSRSGEAVLSIRQQESVQAEHSASKELFVEFVDATQLVGELATCWENLRSLNSQFVSPYFDIQFTQAVDRVRDDVEIAVIQDSDSEIVGFLPYQRIGSVHAEPVGGRLNDAHGAIIHPRVKQVDALCEVMKSAGLRSFGFHAMFKQDTRLEKYEFEELGSHFMDLREGWEAYRQWSRQQTKTIRRQGQKTRALIREIGPLRLELDCTEANELEKLIDLKRAKYQRSRTFDILSVEWAANLLREISCVDTPEFKGLLSTLYAGDQLVAAHFGMLAGEILHYWFPVFDPRFSRYSPGTELLLQVAQTASEQGITKVDLGYGDDAYKFKFCNGIETVSCGRLGFNRFSYNVAQQRYKVRQQLKGIPMKPFAKSVLRGVFPGFEKWKFK